MPHQLLSPAGKNPTSTPSGEPLPRAKAVAFTTPGPVVGPVHSRWPSFAAPVPGAPQGFCESEVKGCEGPGWGLS